MALCLHLDKYDSSYTENIPNQFIFGIYVTMVRIQKRFIYFKISLKPTFGICVDVMMRIMKRFIYIQQRRLN